LLRRRIAAVGWCQQNVALRFVIAHCFRCRRSLCVP
jgi:hypothetical protein